MYRCTLCFAHSVRDCYQNSQKLTQKASIVTDTIAKYLKKKCLLEAGVKVQTCLHFELAPVSRRPRTFGLTHQLFIDGRAHVTKRGMPLNPIVNLSGVVTPRSG